MNETTTNDSRTHCLGRQMNRQTFTIRMPGEIYGNDWHDAHRFVQQHTGTGKPVSNSVMVRLGLWAIDRLRAQARENGEEAVQELGEELVRQAQQIASRKRGPSRKERR